MAQIAFKPMFLYGISTKVPSSDGSFTSMPNFLQIRHSKVMEILLSMAVLDVDLNSSSLNMLNLFCKSSVVFWGRVDHSISETVQFKLGKALLEVS